ncbi:hypothetical protein SAMN03159341_11114 [Paenibacillus sp. 1_12]|uniref:hypothetical protein n=1 Tax=Paenibacillus sp. 1_12 TaxID=1566278 RepID=UPI0008EFBDAA|nr:hypothetical protein [Paenibacillus sp. 1_12]SFL86892.1 hypothetical protein SAMN03159341_11114 [Paenibacillus sp. 1_12]
MKTTEVSERNNDSSSQQPLYPLAQPFGNVDDLFDTTGEDFCMDPTTFKRSIINMSQEKLKEALPMIRKVILPSASNTEELKKLVGILVDRQVALGEVDAEYKNIAIKRLVDDITKDKRSTSETNIVVENNRYYLVHSNGDKPRKELTNFVFDNVRTVVGEGHEESLLLDLRVDDRVVRRNLLLNGETQIKSDWLKKRVKSSYNQTLLNAIYNEFDLLMYFVACQSKGTIQVTDHTGLFLDESSNLYYFIANSGKGTHTYVKPEVLTTEPEELTQISGYRHLESHLQVRNVLSDKSWHETARQMLDLVPRMLKSHKSMIMLSWFFASLISPWLKEELEIKFPILFAFGEKGSGKSTILDLIANYFGIKSDEDVSMVSTSQPIREAMSCSNAFPVVSKEYSDNLSNINTVVNLLKLLFDRDPYKRGQLEGNTTYQLQAPWVMQSNTRCSNEAVQDRMIQILVQKTDQEDCASEISNELLKKKQNSVFVEGYLKYLVDNQHKWQEWDEAAKQMLGGQAYASRGFTIIRSLLIGLQMVQDLRQEVGMEPLTDTVLTSIMNEMKACRQQNQQKPIHMEFLDFVQAYHGTKEYEAKGISARAKSKVGKNDEVDEYRFHQAKWLDIFASRNKTNNRDFDKNVLLEGLKALSPAIEVSASARIGRSNQKCMVIHPNKLEELTKGEFAANLWREQSFDEDVEKFLEETQKDGTGEDEDELSLNEPKL